MRRGGQLLQPIAPGGVRHHVAIDQQYQDLHADNLGAARGYLGIGVGITALLPWQGQRQRIAGASGARQAAKIDIRTQPVPGSQPGVNAGGERFTHLTARMP